MKQSFLIVSITFSLAIYSNAADQPKTLTTKEDIRNAILVFHQDPLSPRGRAAGEIVRRYAEKSTDVMLTITPKLTPFLTNIRLPERDRSLLLAAYIIGNVDSQLLHNEKKDDPYSGVLEVIETYRQMQKRNAAVILPEIENFIELEKRGELKKYVVSP